MRDLLPVVHIPSLIYICPLQGGYRQPDEIYVLGMKSGISPQFTFQSLVDLGYSGKTKKGCSAVVSTGSGQGALLLELLLIVEASLGVWPSFGWMVATDPNLFRVVSLRLV